MEDRRRRSRKRAVLPVRVSSNDDSSNTQCELVHTLDITESGARLGGVHHPPKVGSQITLQYKQHKAGFRVVWTEAVPKRTEYRVGLEALQCKDMWGLGVDFRNQSKAQPMERPGETLRT
ncbi:MAG TPA: PilZ domain-containing protein [Terriglobales bacterium]|nr:PilZ domain-containing protein [Terriglobales bacterium]